MPSVSVRSMPWSSMTAPRGVSTPSRAYRSILPRWFTEVAQSITKGKGSDEGMPKVKGLWSDYDMSEALSSSIASRVRLKCTKSTHLVPIIGSTPNVGAIDGRALVPVSPMLYNE